MTTAAANRAVANLHRHHGACPPALVYFCVGAESDGRLCGVAIVGRPANRNSDDGQTAEVLRVATDGTRNACSFLYGACAKAACGIGFARIITYTLDVESGSSLRGAGWTQEASGIESWWHRYPTKNAADRRTVVERPHHGMTKARWGKLFRDCREVDVGITVASKDDGQRDLF
jgi:hypothetical protein